MKSDRPRIMGKKLYSKMYEYHDNDWGACVAGVIGGQGSVKTGFCLDLAEKKLMFQPNERIFWHDTVGSPCQYLKLKTYQYKLFVENNLELEFVDISNKNIIHPDVTYFKDVYDMYNKSELGVVNVVYFSSKKSWTCFNANDDKDKIGLLDFLMSDEKAANEWQTIIFDELESVFPADCNNRTDEMWWDWTHNSSDKIKECRKSRVGFVGNYHDPNSIFHTVINKFMFHLWGFGSRPRRTRVNQNCVDQLKLGEFWIDHQGTVFGKIKIGNEYKPPEINWVTRYK